MCRSVRFGFNLRRINHADPLLSLDVSVAFWRQNDAGRRVQVSGTLLAPKLRLAPLINVISFLCVTRFNWCQMKCAYNEIEPPRSSLLESRYLAPKCVSFRLHWGARGAAAFGAKKRTVSVRRTRVVLSSVVFSSEVKHEPYALVNVVSSSINIHLKSSAQFEKRARLLFKRGPRQIQIAI